MTVATFTVIDARDGAALMSRGCYDFVHAMQEAIYQHRLRRWRGTAAAPPIPAEALMVRPATPEERQALERAAKKIVSEEPGDGGLPWDGALLNSHVFWRNDLPPLAHERRA